MALFGKKNSIPNTPLNQTSAPITDAENFFKDMGRKKKPVKDTFDIDLHKLSRMLTVWIQTV